MNLSKKKQINTGKLLQYYREKFRNNNNKKLTTTTTKNRAKGKTKQNKTKTSGGNKQQLVRIYISTGKLQNCPQDSEQNKTK